MPKVIGSDRSLLNFKSREEATTTVEYGLMVVLIAGVCLSAVSLLGPEINLMVASIKG